MKLGGSWNSKSLLPPPREWYFIAEQPAPAPHLARPEGRAAPTPNPMNTKLRIGKGRERIPVGGA